MDASVFAHIQRRAAEEHGLFERRSLEERERKRLAAIQVELDQCWDLLRQRRAARQAPGTRPLLGQQVRPAQGRGEAERLSAVQDEDRRYRLFIDEAELLTLQWRGPMRE